ncbi:MAG: monovalent cation/H(+) antiporter subunit G [Lysobacterales bacterium]
MDIFDIISWVLFVSGGAFVFIGGLGAIRLPNFYTRLHAASLTDSMGTILILTAIMFQAGWSLATLKLITILGFLMLTGPTATYALANAALLSGMKPGKPDSAKES